MGELSVFDVTDSLYRVYVVDDDNRYILDDQGERITNWQGTFQKAADAVRDGGGGVLYVPAGTYEIYAFSPDPPWPTYREGQHIPGPGGVQVFSNTWLRGAGPSSLIRRLGTAQSEAIVQVNGQQNVRISDLAFDLNAVLVEVERLDEQGNSVLVWEPQNYLTGVGVGEGWGLNPDGPDDAPTGEASRDVAIERCTFFNTGVRPIESQTEHAILARDVRGLTVRDNVVDGLQIKVAIGRDSRLLVRGNRVRDAFNCGISVVLQELSDVEPSVFDVIVTDNLVEGSHDACLYVGLDSPRDDPNLPARPPSGLYARIVIGGNTLRRPRVNAALLARMPLSASDWLVERNMLEGDPSLVGEDRPYGMSFDSHWPESRLRRLVVTGNVVRGFNSPAIGLRGNIGLTIVRGNRFEDDTGCALPEFGNVTDLVVTANTARSCNTRGFWVRANGADIGPVLFHGNVATDTSGQEGAERPGIWLQADGEGRAQVSLRRNVCTDLRSRGEKTQQWGLVLSRSAGRHRRRRQ